MIKLLVVHHVRMTCELLAAVLCEEPDIHVLSYAQTEDEALSRAAEQKYNTVLIDVHLPNQGALRLANALRQLQPDIKILVMGIVNSKSAILHCVEEGIDGYLLEEEGPSDLVKKLRDIHNGQFTISPSVAFALMNRIADLKQMTKELYGISHQYSDDLFAELTPREWEVIRLIEKNYSNQQIAEELISTPGTVKNHVHSILNKLDVRSREQAVLLMRQLLSGQQPKLTGEHGETRMACSLLNRTGRNDVPERIEYIKNPLLSA
ncbi:MAG: response regulator transcription factor [Anaerolineales bacterium]|nr:response regulator transcription factor [Anaerolineales bacterium]